MLIVFIYTRYVCGIIEVSVNYFDTLRIASTGENGDAFALVAPRFYKPLSWRVLGHDCVAILFITLIKKKKH